MSKVLPLPFRDYLARLNLLLVAYQSTKMVVKLRIIGRYLICPFESFVGAFPSRGEILDVGCGDGLLLLLLTQDGNTGERKFRGIDHSEDKIAVANCLSIPNTSFGSEALEEIHDESYDCISIVDVLYCVPLEKWREILRNCYRILRVGGRLIVKEVTNRPRWKYYLIYLEEVIAIKVLHITRGALPHFESTDTYHSYLEQTGFRCDHAHMLDAGHLHAHCLFLATKLESQENS